ncbi:MAG: protein kinase domain-containing protein [Anaerolineae bacterium]|jgi:serine/threonine protein kinase
MPLETIAAATVVGLVFLVSVVIVIIAMRRGKKLPKDTGSTPRQVAEQPVAETPIPRATPAGSRPQTPRPSAAQPRLIATGGPLAQQTFTISPQGLSIGRHTDNDIVLAEELMVSRHHAVVVQEQGQCVLYDRDSANGTWVNEQRVFRHVLAPGDRIQIWNSQFAYSPHDRVPPQPPPEPPPSPTIHVVGECFCGYQLETLIGRGGMSEVYKARDSQGRPVAIKILNETDPYLVAKFVQEGNQIGPLLRGHENIVYVYEFGQSPDRRLYIVMEYVDAPSLRKSIRGPFSEMDTVKIVGQVCSALAFAHENSVVHRDIKPENILVRADGVAKVLDFGIAKLTSASTVTRDKIVGTPEYISPEQARGDPVQPASDVYSLGILLYEMLTGSVPFRRLRSEEPFKAAIDVIRQHLKEEPEPLRQRNPTAEISPKMEKTTMRALKKELDERFATAKELGEALGFEEAVDRITTSVQPIQASLVIVQGPRHGQRITLSNQTLALGRRELCSNNTTISRRHANIVFRGGSYWLEDVSRNGTWVDNTRVYGEAPLVHGSVVIIGDNVLRLEQSLA